MEGSATYSQEFCHNILKKVRYQMGEVPPDCKKYPTVLATVKRRNSDKSLHAVAFEGLSPGSAANAIAARQQGRPSHAQFQRRLTTNHRFR